MMSFLRNTGQGPDQVDSSGSVRPRFSTPGEVAPQPENLLTQVRSEARPEEVQREPAVREPMTFERESRNMPTPPEKCVNVIAVGSRWKGSLNVPDSVRIDGQVSGDIEAKGTIHISEGAQVEAKVRAAYVVICGSFKGEVRCSERLELLPKSKVQGEIVARVLNVHEGATVDGGIRMSTDKAADGKEEGEPARSTVANGAKSRGES
jgi:cytoskeletal protein CcmA (bactofilin family)